MQRLSIVSTKRALCLYSRWEDEAESRGTPIGKAGYDLDFTRSAERINNFF